MHIENFLQDWLKFGSYEQVLDLQYKLTSQENMQSTLSITHDKITIEGSIPSKTFMLIDTLAKACEADKIIEGEVIDKGNNQFHQQGASFDRAFSGQTAGNFKIPFTVGMIPKITALSKTKLILLLIVTLPLLIIMIPIIIVVAIIKIVLFKLKFK